MKKYIVKKDIKRQYFRIYKRFLFFFYVGMEIYFDLKEDAEKKVKNLNA